MKAPYQPKRVVAFVSLIAALFPLAFASSPGSKRVLLIFDSEIYSPASPEVQKGILNRLRSELGQNTQFFSEQLESNRLPEFSDQALLWVRTRYTGQRIDVVIFVGETLKEILPGVPTVYLLFAPVDPLHEPLHQPGKVAVHFQVDFSKTITAARHLQPDAQRVIVIAGAGYGDPVLLGETRDQLKGLDIPVQYVDGADVNTLEKLVTQLPPKTLIYLITYSHDGKGNIYETPNVVASLSRLSTAPIFIAADTSIGHGAVGGYVVNFERVGATVADIAVQDLEGKAPAQILIPPDQTANYIFDWRELKRWGFHERDLPPGSIVEFKVPTIWEQYRWRIIGILVLLVLQSVLIVGLLISRRRRKKAEASLRDMTGRLLESQDEERRRIARDLHDGTGQHLSGMALTIGQVLADFPPGHDRLRKLLQDSHIASRQALDEVRTVSYVLHPPILDGLGLVPALRWYLDGLEKRTSLKIDFESPAEVSHLSPEAERALFRIVQESVTNVLRHSGGTAIRVELSKNAKGVTLEIDDNGQGMSTEQLSQLEGASTLGVGIAGMRERVRQLGGSFQIQSGLHGTRVLVTVAADEERYAAHSAGR